MTGRPDVLVLGAGPAGVSAALWARSFDLSCRVLERADRPGGQLHHVYFELENLAGSPRTTGVALADVLARQLEGYDVHYGVEVAALDPARPSVRLASGEWHEARAVLVALGVRRRRLEIPGAEAFENRGLSYSATRDLAQFAGKSVVVVGGGDAAYDNALLLSRAGCRVALAVRGEPRARTAFRARVAGTPAIEVLDDVELMAVRGDDRVRAVRYRDARGEHERAADGVVVKIGVTPNSESLAGTLDLDDEGYVRVDATLRTSHPRVWAAGDITRPPVLGIPVALGQAALALEGIRAGISRLTGQESRSGEPG